MSMQEIVRRLAEFERRFENFLSDTEIGGNDSGWTDDGAIVRLTTSTDNVSIGAVTNGAKLDIVGVADEVQLSVTANATQTENAIEVKSSAGTALTVIDGSGKVGIGTDSPSAQLEILKTNSAALGGEILIANASATAASYSQLKFGASSAPSIRYAAIQGIAEGSNSVQLAFLTGVGASITKKMTILSGGNVGIGTTTPGQLFEVSNSTVTTTRVTCTTGTTGRAITQLYVGAKLWDFGLNADGSNTDSFMFRENAVTRLLLKAGGRVGIGAASPAGKLHAAGTADEIQGIFQANATQTNNIVEIQSSAGTALAYFNNVGKLTVPTYIRHIQIPASLTGNPSSQPDEVDFFTMAGLQFATSGTKYAYCQWEIPGDWDGTDIYFEVDWVPDSGAMTAPAAVKWNVEYACVAEGEIHGATSKTITVTHATSAARYLSIHSRMTMAYNDATQPLTKYDHVYFKISRDTGVANDFGGSVTVPAFEIIYNSTTIPTGN